MSTDRGGVIHDLGYQHYTGPRLGRPAIVRALCWHSLRSAFGIGRGAKAKIVPATLLVIMCLPAVVNAVLVARSADHARVIPYDSYVFQLRVLVMTIFVAVQAPELVSRDLRSHVLPLYLSRPLRRLDYPLAKYAAFTIACLLVLEIPLLLLYLGTLVSATGGAMIWDETRALAAGAGLAALWAVLLAGIGLLLASLTGRRAFATGGIAIVFFLSWTVAGLISGLLNSSAGALFSPFTVLDEVRQWLGGAAVPGGTPAPGGAGPLFGVMFAALLAGSLAGLAARYRRVGAA